MVNRSGVGQVRHLDVKDLSVQERVKRGSFSISRVSGDVNPADVAMSQPSLSTWKTCERRLSLWVPRFCLESRGGLTWTIAIRRFFF